MANANEVLAKRVLAKQVLAERAEQDSDEAKGIVGIPISETKPATRASLDRRSPQGKRQMTEKQLENLKKRREKKQLLLLQSKEVTADKKLTKKQEKELKEQKLKEEYEKVLEKKKQVSYTENDEPVALVSLAEREQPKQKPVAVAKASASAPVPVTRAERQVERRLLNKRYLSNQLEDLFRNHCLSKRYMEMLV